MTEANRDAIEQLLLKPRIRNALLRGRIYTIEELSNTSDEQLSHIRHIGVASIKEIREGMSAYRQAKADKPMQESLEQALKDAERAKEGRKAAENQLRTERRALKAEIETLQARLNQIAGYEHLTQLENLIEETDILIKWRKEIRLSFALLVLEIEPISRYGHSLDPFRFRGQLTVQGSEPVRGPEGRGWRISFSVDPAFGEDLSALVDAQKEMGEISDKLKSLNARLNPIFKKVPGLTTLIHLEESLREGKDIKVPSAKVVE
jgi:hypothetical protein